jgi:iron(III) transport system substrate-binding protein
VLDQVIAGQFPMAIQIFNDQVALSASQGAPVAWQALDPVYAPMSRYALAKNSPHPNAAMLFLDFSFSKEGQQVLAKAGSLPSHPDVAPLDPTLKPQGGNFKANVINPDDDYKQSKAWQETFTKLFLH